MGERGAGSSPSPPPPPAFTIPTRNSAVSLSSLLSSSESDHHSHPVDNSSGGGGGPFDAVATVAPIALPRPRGALSSLMNSPMDALTDPMSPASPASESPREPHATAERVADAGAVDALTDLETLQHALQSAALRLLSAEDGGGGPPAKRQKKGKHGRKQKPSTTTADESAAEIHKCVELLSLRVQHEAEVLCDVVRFCLALCAELSDKDPVEKSVVKRSGQSGELLDFDATLAALPLKPLYFQLLSVVRRAVISADEHDVRALMAQMLEWCLATSAPANWSWVLAFVGQISAFEVLEFLVHDLIFGERDKDEVVVPTIEYLVAQNPAQLVDIIRDLVEEAASDGVAEIRSKSVQWVVRRVISVATEYAVFLRACDDSLQFFVTVELVLAMAPKLISESRGDETKTNGVDGSPLAALLLQLLEKRSAEMVHSGFQLILLLQALTSSKASSDPELLPLASTVQLAEAASAFHTQVLAMAEREAPPQAFLTGVHRFLPFISQSALQGLRASRQQPEKETGLATFEHWRRWLVLIAQRLSQADVTKHLVEADLMLSEVLPLGSADAPVVTSVLPEDAQLSDLLSSILTPLSGDYVQFVTEMMDSCNASAPRNHQRRVLSILQALLQQNGADKLQAQDEATTELPIDIREVAGLTVDDAVGQIMRAESWSQSWKRFEMWKGTEGVNFWEGFVDLACSRDPEVAARALTLVSQTPFRTLEDPMWQYRCLRKLTSVFFHLLRQYRAEIVSVRSKQNAPAATVESNPTQQRLEKMKTVLFQVLAQDGGVAHYASSVFTTFASLWIDALFTTSTPTSIPTHFPNRVNFSAGEEWEEGVEDRVVIRSERTISSKSTNLQSSQVITQISDTLVYRKALDSSWEREMDAAHTCSMYATDLVFQLVNTTVPLAGGSRPSGAASAGRHGASDYVERKLKAVTDLLLERAIPSCGIPSDEVYKETLPNRSSFDMDLRIEQWLNHFPSFLPLLRAVVMGSASIGSHQSLRLVPLVKSTLVVLLGHWNSVKGELSRENMDVPPYMRNRNQLALTCELVQILRLTGWLPPPLGRTAELLPLTTSADIRGILFSCWFYLCDHPPSDGLTPASSRAASPTSAASSPSTGGGSSGATSNNHANVPLEFYLVPVRKALHNNIRAIGAKYPLFMC